MFQLGFNNWKKYQPRQDYKRPWWFAFSNNFFTDPDFSKFSSDEKVSFLYLMCEASRQAKSGEFSICTDMFSRLSGIDSTHISKTIDKLLKLNVLYRICTGSVQNLYATEHNITGQDRGSGGEILDALASADKTSQEGLGGPSPTNLVELWNEHVNERIARVKDLTQGRIRHAKARLKKYPNVDDWIQAIEKINHSKFCLGLIKPKDGRKPWRATFDWLIKPDTLAKILEGQYDDK